MIIDDVVKRLNELPLRYKMAEAGLFIGMTISVPYYHNKWSFDLTRDVALGMYLTGAMIEMVQMLYGEIKSEYSKKLPNIKNDAT